MTARVIIVATGRTGPSKSATNITVAPTGDVAATNVQDAIAELASEKQTAAQVLAVLSPYASAITDHIADTSDAHDASAISYVGSTNLAATDVEAALDELDTEKVAYEQGVTDGNVRGPGTGVLAALTTGMNNTAMGKQALWKNTTGNGNVAIGDIALRNNTIGVTNVAVGENTLVANVLGSCNVAVGPACLTNTLGDDNTAVGSNAMTTNSTGQSNVAIGTYALQYNTTADSNVAVGFGSLRSNITGTGLTAIGREALQTATAAVDSLAVGFKALYSNVTGTGNTAIGRDALYSATGDYNTAHGPYALRSATASYNTAIGYSAGYQPNGVVGNATGIGVHQTLVGFQTGQSTSGNIPYLTCVGSKAVGALNGVAVGYTATASGDYATAVGSGATSSHTRSIALGYQTVTSADDQLSLGGRHIEVYELAADPSAPAANRARIYSRDNGSGKTQVCVRFNTGAVQVLATEP